MTSQTHATAKVKVVKKNKDMNELSNGANILLNIIFIIAVTLIVGVDANRAAKIAATGMANNNLALFMAYNFYVDFIGIFLRVLLLLASSRNN